MSPTKPPYLPQYRIIFATVANLSSKLHNRRSSIVLRTEVLQKKYENRNKCSLQLHQINNSEIVSTNQLKYDSSFAISKSSVRLRRVDQFS